MTKTKETKLELTEYIEKQRSAKFKWGTADCCTFAGGAALIITGVNPWDEFIDDCKIKYTDEKTGRALMERYGGLARILTDKYGHHHQHGRYGDLAYKVFPDGSAVGVCVGTVSIFLAEKGLVEIENKECRFFKVR